LLTGGSRGWTGTTEWIDRSLVNPIGIGQFVASEGGGAQAHSAGSCQRTIPDRNQAQILAIVPVEAGPDRLELFPGI